MATAAAITLTADVEVTASTIVATSATSSTRQRFSSAERHRHSHAGQADASKFRIETHFRALSCRIGANPRANGRNRVFSGRLTGVSTTGGN
jgi:hypothetical protein